MNISRRKFIKTACMSSLCVNSLITLNFNCKQEDSRSDYKVLISACLLGEKIRYNGTDAFINNDLLYQLQNEGRLLPFCPELAAGFPIPRPAAEIINGEGINVIQNSAYVLEINGNNVTDKFYDGAVKTLRIAELQNVKVAILKDGSPSCGVNYIFDGSFTGKTKSGKGVTAYLLEHNNIQIFSENQIEQAKEYLIKL